MASSLLLRRGISLTEVLISMGILTFGLLGVVAMFAVGGFYMRRAEIADHGSAVAQSVMNDIAARGMLDPKAWQILVTTPPSFMSTPPLPTDPDKASANYFARSVGRAMAADPDQSPLHLVRQYGSAFVIDPMSIAVIASVTSTGYNTLPAPFPAEAYAYSVAGMYASQAWQTWNVGTMAPQLWPIRRVTFLQPYPTSPMLRRLEAPVAASLFSTTDDLALDLPSRDDRPAIQLWDQLGSAPLKRQSVGDYSWIVTIVPTSSEAQTAIGRNPQSHAYDVSVVVFYKRAIPRALVSPLSAYFDLVANEAVVGGSVISRGLNGGELLLRLFGTYSSDSPFEKLRPGQWLMVCGPHPTSSLEAPRFVMNWYQVMAIDEEGAGITGFDPTKHRVVALRGPEWPWQPDPTGDLFDNTQLSNDLCVGIFPGAVAVHTKTMRLEGPRTSVRGGSFSSGVSGAAAADDPGGVIGY